MKPEMELTKCPECGNFTCYHNGKCLYCFNQAKEVQEIKDIIQEAMNYLSDASNADEEIERESVINLFAESIFKLSVFIKVNKNLKDAICLIQTAVEKQIKSIYERDKISSLTKKKNKKNMK